MKQMNRVLGLCLTMTLAGAAARAADAVARANATNRFEISGMHCDGCAKGLTAEFKSTPGVVSAEVNFSNRLAVVSFDTNRVTSAKLVSVAKEAGFLAKPTRP